MGDRTKGVDHVPRDGGNDVLPMNYIKDGFYVLEGVAQGLVAGEEELEYRNPYSQALVSDINNLDVHTVHPLASVETPRRKRGRPRNRRPPGAPKKKRKKYAGDPGSTRRSLFGGRYIKRYNNRYYLHGRRRKLREQF